MYYLDDELSLHEATEVPVYRVFGGDVQQEGGFVTDTNPGNPIQARGELALSQHDFTGPDGTPMRNMASQVASCSMHVDDEGHIINLNTGEVTDDTLAFTTVEPTSDLPGGGMEYHLQGDFNDLVQVNSVDDLRHTPTQGWLDYLEAEDRIINGDSDSSSPDAWEESYDSDTAAIDDLIDDEESILQGEDVQSQWEDYIGESVDDGMDTETAAIDGLIDEEEYNLQAEDVQSQWEDYLDNYDKVDSTSRPADIDGLIDDEEYNLQAEDVEDSFWSGVSDEGYDWDDSWDSTIDDSWDDGSTTDDSWDDDSTTDDSWDDSSTTDDSWDDSSTSDDSWDDSSASDDSWDDSSTSDDSWDDSSSSDDSWGSNDSNDNTWEDGNSED